MKNPNGYGGITKLSGNRRKPFWVRITAGWDITPTGKQKQIYKTLGYYASRKEAMLALAEYNLNPYDLANAELTFEDCYEKWTVKHFEKYPSSETGLRSAFKKCEPIQKMKMSEIRTAHLQMVMDSIAHQSTQTQVKLKTVFNKTFEFAMENDIIKKDYSSFVKVSRNETKKDKSKFFTKDDIKLILSHVGERDVDTLVILLYTGMRISELLSLKSEDVDLEKRIIHVRGTKTDNADRFVPIHKELIPYIEKRIGNEYLITTPRGKSYIYNNYRTHFFLPFMEKLGLNQTIHATRHTFISAMDASGIGADSVVLKRIVGHSNSTVTEGYTHKTHDDLIEAIDKFKLL